MTLIGSGININMAQMAAGALAGGGYQYDFGFQEYTGQNLNVYNEWDEVTGSNDIRYNGGGTMYAQGIGYYRWITPEELPDNQYMSFKATDSWVTAGEHMGMMVRGSTTQKSGYCLRIGDDGQVLSRWDNNVETILDSNVTTPVLNDKYEIRAVGSTITTLKNGAELFADVVDTTYTGGWCGMVSKGLDVNAEVGDLRCGAYPKGNALKFQGRIAFPILDGVQPITTSCFDITPDNIWDGSAVSSGQHGAPTHNVGGTNMHWYEMDCGAPLYTTGMQAYDRLTYHATVHWDDVSVFARNDESDPWTTLVANGDMSDELAIAWLPVLSWDTPGTYRYYRVEIYSTLHATDNIVAYDVPLIGVPLT
jgi:hypothetical protein